MYMMKYTASTIYTYHTYIHFLHSIHKYIYTYIYIYIYMFEVLNDAETTKTGITQFRARFLKCFFETVGGGGGEVGGFGGFCQGWCYK